MRKSFLFTSGVLTILLLCAFLLTDVVEDGPYVIKSGSKFTTKWITGDILKIKKLSKKNFSKFDKIRGNYFDPSVLFSPPINYSKFDFQGVDKVAALSDVHGQYDLMIKILTNNGVIDKSGKWSFGKGHFVMVGDVFDRGDKVTECLWFLYRLEHEANAAGGRVHYVLGNHEIMVMTGDLRYIHDKYKRTEQHFQQHYFQLFGKGTVLGDWLRSKPITMSINNIQFVHGGLSPVLASSKLSAEDINSIFTDRIIDAVPSDSIYNDKMIKFLDGAQGPIWYRGYFNDPNFNEQLLNSVLTYFDKQHVVVGHTSMTKVESRFNGKVVVVDSSIKLGEYGEILIVEGGKFMVGDPDGNRRELE